MDCLDKGLGLGLGVRVMFYEQVAQTDLLNHSGNTSLGMGVSPFVAVR